VRRQKGTRDGDEKGLSGERRSSTVFCVQYSDGASKNGAGLVS
jgi:hypothetical protein